MMLSALTFTVIAGGWQVFVSPDTKQWGKARRFCRDHGADLAVIPDLGFNSQLANALAQDDSKFWIGLRKSARGVGDGAWRWIDGSAASQVLNWAPREPSQYRFEDCTEMYVRRADGTAESLAAHGRWNDDFCDRRKRALCLRAPANDTATAGQTTARPETAGHTTASPTARSTAVSSTTAGPTAGPTADPTTVNPTTVSPVVADPTTVSPTTVRHTVGATADHITPGPTTVSPTTVGPTVGPTADPTTVSPTTVGPTVGPTTVSPTTVGSTVGPTADPKTVSPTTMSPTAGPTTGATAGPTTPGPTTVRPTTAGPTTARPTTGPTAGPATVTPTVGPAADPKTARPTSGPTTARPTSGPTTARPTSGPTTARPTSGPTTAGPTSGPTADPTRDDNPLRDAMRAGERAATVGTAGLLGTLGTTALVLWRRRKGRCDLDRLRKSDQPHNETFTEKGAWSSSGGECGGLV